MQTLNTEQIFDKPHLYECVGHTRDATLLLICEVHMVCRSPLAALSMHHFLQKNPYEVCGHLVLFLIPISCDAYISHFMKFRLPCIPGLIKYIINLLYFFAPLISAVDIQQLVWRGGGNTCLHWGGGERKSMKTSDWGCVSISTELPT